MSLLEDMLREVESVSAVLDFEDDGLLNGRAAEKGGLRVASNGVATLAAEAGEDLRAWREQQEAEHQAREQELRYRLQETIDQKKQEEVDRENVRQAVRVRLFAQARTALARGVDHHAVRFPAAAAKEEAAGGPHAASTHESAGAEALMRLKTHLDLIASPVEAMRPDRPPEMQQAAKAAMVALERKRLRMPAQRQQLLEATGHVDAELLGEADATAGARKVALAEQGQRQSDVFKLLQEAMAERQSLFEDLDGQARTGPPPMEPGAWATLWPPSGGVAPGEGAAATDKEKLRRQLIQRGEDRIAVLVQEFQHKHLQSTPSARAMNADLELEEWKVRAHQELLEGVRSGAELKHRDLMRFLQDTLAASEASSLEQLSAAVSAAEAFKRTRTDSISQHCRFAESSVVQFSEQNLEQVRSRRRRVELCAWKRWGDIKEHLDRLTEAADASGLLAIGEAAQRCVEECHEVIQMPSSVGDLRESERPELAEALLAGWDRDAIPSGERLDFICQTLERLPDTSGTCAVTRGVLCTLDDELKHQIQKLKGRLQVLDSAQGSLQAAQ